MIRVKIKELNEYLKHFNNRKVKIIIKGVIEEEEYPESLSIIYEHENGYLYLYDNKNVIKINMTSVSLIQVTEDYQRLEIQILEGESTQLSIYILE